MRCKICGDFLDEDIIGELFDTDLNPNHKNVCFKCLPSSSTSSNKTTTLQLTKQVLLFV